MNRRAKLRGWNKAEVKAVFFAASTVPRQTFRQRENRLRTAPHRKTGSLEQWSLTMTTSTIDIESKKQFAQPKLQTNQPPQQQVEIQQSWEWAKVRKIALRQMDKFMDLFPPVLRHEDLTAVNEMRVSCRRLEE